ncbi:MAG: SAM-dependent methyltransferase, partial [Propionibacteriaceae bacterium]|nr:SAM-dependent methyltransferase [Propionibacteriaceae bacterium]
LADDLLARPDPHRAVFLDPARRTGAGRSWRLDDLRPSWGFVLDLIAAGHPVIVKLGPGFDRGLIPAGVEACWVSERGDAVELGLWRLGGEAPGSRRAVALPSGRELVGCADAPGPRVGPVGGYLLEPDGVVGRAGLLPQLVASLEHDTGAPVWRLDGRASYLSSDAACHSPFVACFTVLDTFSFTEKALRAWVRDHRVGALEIKLQGFDLDPAALRRRLHPSGPASATVVLAHTAAGATVLVCRRL